MKKKLLVGLLTCLMLGNTFSVCAEEMNEVTSPSESIMKLNAEVVEEYIVRIPKMVNLGEETTTFNIEAKGKILTGSELVVTYNEEVVMTNSVTNETCNAKVSLSDNIFHANDLKQDEFTKREGSIVFEAVTAGSYVGDVVFNVVLQEHVHNYVEEVNGDGVKVFTCVCDDSYTE